MQKRYRTLIAKAQQGDKEVMSLILEDNKRTNMEYCKKIFRKRIWSRWLISDCMYRLYRGNTEV